jgi:hypothetical protein
MNKVRYAAAAPLLTGATAADDHSEVSMSIGRNGSNRRNGRGRVMTSTILALPIRKANHCRLSAALWPVPRFPYSRGR